MSRMRARLKIEDLPQEPGEELAELTSEQAEETKGGLFGVPMSALYLASAASAYEDANQTNTSGGAAGPVRNEGAWQPKT